MFLPFFFVVVSFTTFRGGFLFKQQETALEQNKNTCYTTKVAESYH